MANLSRLLADRGMVLVLLGVCAYYSYATFGEQRAEGAAGGDELAQEIIRQTSPRASVLVVVRDTQEDGALADALATRLVEAGRSVAARVQGQPADARQALDRLARSGSRLDAVAANEATASWAILQDLGR